MAKPKELVMVDGIDVIDEPEAYRSAAEHHIAIRIDRRDSPNGYPTAELIGDREDVETLLINWGYDGDFLVEMLGHCVVYELKGSLL